MSPIKKVFYYFTSLIFYLVLLITPLVFAITVVFSSAGNVTGALKDSGVYDRYVDLVLDSSAKNTTDEQTKQLLENDDIRNIARESFTPELLERTSNDVLQGIYSWLEGKTPEPQFTIDLTTAKATLTEKLSNYAEERAASLPTCTLAQLQTIDPTSDLLNLPCLPPGLTAAQVGERFSQQLLTNSDFLEQPIITNQTLTEQNNGRPITANAQDVPARYQQAQDFKWLLVAVAIVLGLLLIFARHDRRAGLKLVAWALVLSAAFLAVALLSYWYVFDKVTSVNSQGSEVQSMVFDGATVLLADINRVIGWFAASYAAIGLGTLLLLRRNGQGEEPGTVNHPPATSPLSTQNPADTKK